MPELPEVETTLRGIKPHIIGRKISEVKIRNKNLRWPVSKKYYSLAGSKFSRIKRRGKYILIDVNDGTLLIHLGMSGSLSGLNTIKNSENMIILILKWIRENLSDIMIQDVSGACYFILATFMIINF